MNATPAPSPWPLLTIEPGQAPPRVAVITGSYGTGHDAAAYEIARVLRETGCTVEVHDVVKFMRWNLGGILKTTYYQQIRRNPSSWGVFLQLLEPGRPLHGAVQSLLRTSAAPVLEVTGGCDLAISTHPFAAQALGQARATGRLTVPSLTYLTDISVHPLWIHPGNDMNLAIHRLAATEARAMDAPATVIRPLVSPRFIDIEPVETDPLAPFEIVGPRALVTGGALGMGELENSARDILAGGVMTPVVLCGTDDGLRRRLARIPGVVALGWRDDVPSLLSTSDCVVQNAGGFSSLEALASGTPVITYRPLPGHGVTNAANLERAGLIPWAHSTRELARLLDWACTAPRRNRLPGGAPEVQDLLVTVQSAAA